MQSGRAGATALWMVTRYDNHGTLGALVGGAGMTEADLNKLWNVIPVGETNAAATSTIWKCFGMYARPTVQHQLTVMAEAGRIHRISRSMPMDGEVHLFYRLGDQENGTDHFPPMGSTDVLYCRGTGLHVSIAKRRD